MRTGYIYCITNEITGKQYIGQTNTSVTTRYNEHLRCALSGTGNYLLYLSMRKYGIDNFHVETIEVLHADSAENLKSILNEREIFHIADKSTYKPNGYNMTLGGQSFADHHVVGVYEVDALGFVLAHHQSMRDAQRDTGTNEASIWHACNSKSHFSNGRFWYLDSNNFEIGQNIGVQSRGKNNWFGHRTKPQIPVSRFTKDGAYIDTFESASDAAKQLNISQAHISKCCNGLRNTTGGYRWSFANQK